MTEYPKFSEFAAGDAKLDGEKVTLKDILNLHLVRRLILTNEESISMIASHTEKLGIHNPFEEFLRKTTW